MSTGKTTSATGQKRSTRLQEYGRRHLDSAKPTELPSSGQLDTRNSFPQLSRGNHQKPHQSRKVAGMEEVVKNMSSVPCYLQRLDKEDTLQKKALNFGVLDWGSLEKWTYLQKQAPNRRIIGDSLPTSNASSLLFSTAGSSSVPTRESDSPLARREPTPTTVDARRDCFNETRRSKLTKEQSCRRRLQFPDSGDGHAKMSAAHNQENGKRTSDAGSSPTLKDYNTSPSAYDSTKIQIGKSRETGQQIFFDSLRQAENSLQEQCAQIQGVWDHLQESARKGCTSSDFAVASKERPGEADRNSFSGSFPTVGIPFTNPSSQVSHSCPFPSTGHSGKSVVSPLRSRNEVTTTKTKGKHGKRDIVADNSSGNSAVNVADRPGQNGVKVPTSLRRELSPHRLLRAGINRIISYSVREGSSGNQLKQTSCSAHEEDEVAARGRRSPFKRILNPLLKSNNRSQFSGPLASSRTQETQDVSNSNKIPIRDELEPVKGRCKSCDAGSNPSTSQVINSACPVQDEKNTISTNQALLKLAWKNGSPLFIFSSNDNNIFAATMGKRSVAEKNDSECIYTLFTAHEIQRKGGIGKGQGNKIKKQGLVYSVVGQMKVSSSKFSTEREFVLFGGHLVPTDQPVTSLLNNELAAIIVKVPGRSSESSKLNALQSTTCRKSPQMNSQDDSFSGIVAILPSGVHGFSTEGEPSPLIKRWRYGGSCDCGGWDEGCMLTVLTDRAKERSSGTLQSSTVDGNESRCIELFNQGATGKERVFTMVASKEGVYCVEFGPSIALLQAFAICIATLHSSTPTILGKLHYSTEARSVQNATLADYTRMTSRKS